MSNVNPDSKLVDEILKNTSKILRPYAENIIDHTLRINDLAKLEKQCKYVQDRIDNKFLTPYEAAVVTALITYKREEIEFSSTRSNAAKTALRRILGAETSATLDMLWEEFKNLDDHSIELCFEFKDIQVQASNTTLNFFDLLRRQAFANEGETLPAGSWVNKE